MTTNHKFKPLFGRYVLLRRIGKGGMAEVFRALSFGAKGFRKRVAIKRILENLSTDTKFSRMFITEAAIASQLNHSNIVQIHDFGQVDGMLFHALDYVHGMSLLDLLKVLTQRDAPPPLGPACYVIKEALYGLEHAHRQCDAKGRPLNIIHRDLTPANLLLSYDGEVKITDFGIAKATPSTIRTAAGMLKGKVRYMSPEQSRSLPLDQRSDIFSLGVCLYEMATLHRLYTGKTQYELVIKANEGNFVRPKEHNPHIPEELELILLKALAVDREQRFPDASAFRDALESFMANSQLGFFRSDMNRFMETNFTERIEQEQQQMIEEAELASRLQPKSGWSGSVDKPLELDNAIDLDIEVDTGNWPAERGVAEEGPLPPQVPRPPTVGSGVHDLPIDQGEEEIMDDMRTETIDATDLADKMWDDEQEETKPRRTLRAIPAVQIVVPSLVDEPIEQTKPMFDEPDRNLSSARTQKAMPVVRLDEEAPLNELSFDDETVPIGDHPINLDDD